jgi:hypothetical protein
MEEFKYQLVLQLPGTTQEDFEVLVGLEESLANALNGTPHEVDGHDFGSGTMNIFIDTNDPSNAFALAKSIIDPAEYPLLKAAGRAFDEDDYQLLWPEDAHAEFKLI